MTAYAVPEVYPDVQVFSSTDISAEISAGAPEAKVYLDTPHAQVPGDFELT